MTQGPRVGILAIQGDVDAHARALARAGAEPCEVRTEKDIDGLDALVLPGGESTTISKGMARLGLYAPLRERIRAGMPVLGTCAGAILLARQVENRPVETLELLDIIAVRNAYGTQIDSFAAEVDAGATKGLEGLRCVFIRAPRLRRPGEEVRVLARVDGEPVLVQQGHLLAATFHPELTDDTRVHRRLIELVSRR
jgi:pyridoxal 5'-phosphate synthase pdxT subunit